MVSLNVKETGVIPNPTKAASTGTVAFTSRTCTQQLPAIFCCKGLFLSNSVDKSECVWREAHLHGPWLPNGMHVGLQVGLELLLRLTTHARASCTWRPQ
eukprot:365961-Chlamydomonas_euryale.AAC.7